MNNISTIDGMHQFLQEEFSVEITCRGRKFKINGEVLTLNAIVKKVQSIAATLMPDDEAANQKLYEITHRIKKMDRDGDVELGKQNFFLKITTFFCRLFGNLGFNRNTILTDIQSRPLKLLVNAFSNISKELMETEFVMYEDFNSQYEALQANEKNDPKKLKSIKEDCQTNNISRFKSFRKEQVNAYKQAHENYCKQLELYKSHSQDSDLKILFDSIQHDKLHVFYLLSRIEDRSFILEYFKNDSKMKKDNKIPLAICEMNQMAQNDFVEHVKKLNEIYEALRKELDVEKFLNHCCDVLDGVKDSNREDLKKYFAALSELESQIDKYDLFEKYDSTCNELLNLAKSKSDLTFIVENLSDKNRHLLFFAIINMENEKNNFIDFLNKDYQWPNEEIRGKFEKSKGIKLKISLMDVRKSYAELNWNGHPVKKYIDDCLELSEKVKTVDLEGLKKLIIELMQKFNPNDSDGEYSSAVSKLEGLIKSKSDYEFVVKNLAENNDHLLIFFLNSLKSELMDYLSQDFEWPHKEVKDKFEKLKEFKLKISQLLPKSE